MSKLWFCGWVAIVCFLFSCQQQGAKEQTEILHNLVTEGPGTTPSYWCTWAAQNYATDTATLRNAAWGVGGHTAQANNLTQEQVFGANGWSAAIPSDIRQDLYILFDVGWDIAPDTNLDQEGWRLGNLTLSTDKFPACQGSEVEKLACLNRLTQEAGWKGAGIWVAAQPGALTRDKQLTIAQMEPFYREWARWSQQAGIHYWKVDYGRYGADLDFRQMLSTVAREEAPDLLVEQARNSGPLNDEECPWDTEDYTRSGRFRPWGSGSVLETAVQTVDFSQVYRTYDVTAQLSVASTLDRVAQIMTECQRRGVQGGLLNSEDEVTIGAVLGNAIGIMRHPDFGTLPGNNYDPYENHRKMDEVVRAVRWQRLAPAFPIGEANVLLDTAYLQDTWTFSKGDSWAYWLLDQSVMQMAPARLSRGMALPQVEADGDAPYVIAGQHPNGATAVATLPRVRNRQELYPPAEVTLAVEQHGAPIGVFGHYQSLTLAFASLPQGYRVLAQDLADDQAVDITDQVVATSNTIMISGELLEEIGLSAATPGDLSPPGLVLKVLL